MPFINPFLVFQKIRTQFFQTESFLDFHKPFRFWILTFVVLKKSSCIKNADITCMIII